ncbi:MAG: tyrosine-type recombinase/integrase, partial [Mycobacterium sp.]
TGPAPHGGSTVAARRMTAVRGFARYLSGIDPATEIPPVGLIRVQQQRKTPFIYSDIDIAAMLTTARTLCGDRLRNETYYTLIGLLATTGLRIGEAIKLDLADIDHGDGVLLIRESKFGKSRLVPIHPSTMSAIDAYLTIRAIKPGADGQPALFISCTGRRLCYPSVCQTFRKIVTEAGVGTQARRPPRLHDLRHRFAVATLRGWYAAGDDDVQAKLPALSTYLGHREPASTYWYLSATADLLAAAAGRQHLGWSEDPS